MAVHSKARDRSKARGVRLLESTWLELAAIQKRREYPTIQAAIAEAVKEFIEADQKQRLAA